MSYFTTAADAVVEKERKRNNSTDFVSPRSNKLKQANYTNLSSCRQANSTEGGVFARLSKADGCCRLVVRIEACGAKPFLFFEKRKVCGLSKRENEKLDRMALTASDPSSNLGSSIARFRTGNPKYAAGFRYAQSCINMRTNPASERLHLGALGF